MRHDVTSPEPGSVARELPHRLLDLIDRRFLHEIQQVGLQDLVRVTGSRNGYLFVLDGAPSDIRIHTVVAPGAAPLMCVEDGRPADCDRPGYWSACLAAGAPVIRNAPSSFDTPLTATLGPMRRDLAVPVRDGARIVAVVGVGNRPTDYGPAERELLAELAAQLWRVIVRKRLRDLHGAAAD